MKKLILTTAVALATILNANVLDENKSYTCKLFSNNNFIEMVKNDDVKDFIKSVQTKDNTFIVSKISGKAKGIEEALNNTLGTLNAEFLKEKGIGIKTNLSYRNLYWNYNIFLAKLVDANSEIDMVAFFENRYFELNKNESLNSILSKKIAMVDFFRANRELDFNMFIKFVMNNKDKKINKFFKFIAVKDYVKAYNFIADENDKSGFIDVLKNLRNSCSSNQTKTIKDILSFSDNTDDIKQEIVKDKNGFVDYLYITIKRNKTVENTKDYADGFVSSYKKRLMSNCNDKNINDDSLKIDMKVVIRDELNYEYNRFHINKETCSKWKKSN